jgi:hypothetical protein
MQAELASRIEGQVAVWLRGPLSSGARGLMRMQVLSEYVEAAGAAEVGTSLRPPPALALQPFDAARAKFAKASTEFDCTSFMPMFTSACYVEPRLLELRAAPLQIETGEWRRPISPWDNDTELVTIGKVPPPPRFRRDDELLKYAQSWQTFKRPR